MMTIGLFEPSFHQALIPPMTRIAHETTNDVTVFTTEEHHSHATAALDDTMVEACRWVVKNEDESYRSFFQRVERATAKLDVLWTITPYGSTEVVQALLGFSPRCPSVTFMHASSRSLPTRYPVAGTVIVPFFEHFGHFLPEPILNRTLQRVSGYLAPHIIREYDSVIALYPPIMKFIQQNVEPDALVDWFLYDFYQPDAAVDHDGLRITIPGRVRDSLREYNLLFDVLDNVSDARDRLTVCLLGRRSDDSSERIFDRCRRYEERGYEIEYYPNRDWVPAEEFAHQLARTDLIFSPDNIRGDTGGGRRNPVRGRTKTSGAIGDAVHVGRPLVMPREFTVAPEFEDLITTYEDGDDAVAFIESWLSSEERRRELQKRAETTAQQFSLSNQTDRFEYLCQQTIRASGQEK